LQARATSLSFSLLEPIPSTPGEDEEDGFARDRRSRRADPDVLPTLLAYKNGELEHTFVRVDWEVGADGAGLEDLLVRWVGAGCCVAVDILSIAVISGTVFFKS
jgi:hypothetical protein